jgi:hypothetical protein
VSLLPSCTCIIQKRHVWQPYDRQLHAAKGQENVLLLSIELSDTAVRSSFVCMWLARKMYMYVHMHYIRMYVFISTIYIYIYMHLTAWECMYYSWNKMIGNNATYCCYTPASWTWFSAVAIRQASRACTWHVRAQRIEDCVEADCNWHAGSFACVAFTIALHSWTKLTDQIYQLIRYT